jgi:hypothetical protein
MPDRDLLGPADVSDEVFTALVAEQLGVDEVRVTSCDVQVVEYGIEALTTAGRYWVRGTARHRDGESAYAFFVKVVQSWTRTPAFTQVPEPMREVAAAGLPWRNEPAVYGSDLRSRLPGGLSMPRSYRVCHLDELSAALWLEVVEHDPRPWDGATFARAAYLLGRLAASPAVAPLRSLGSRSVVRSYAGGRIAHQVLPTLQADELWQHPLVRKSFGAELRTGLLAAADALPDLLDELDAIDLGSAHGDASPNNLLLSLTAPDAFVLIDFGFWCEAPVGFDLSQLLLGEIQLGLRSATELDALEAACLPAYVQGLHDEGCPVPAETVRRAHALLMLLFGGLTAVPLEVMFGMPAPGTEATVRERAGAARFILDLVQDTDRARTGAR